MMDRRRFVLASLAGALALPLTTDAQRAAKVYRVGYLGVVRPVTDTELQAWNSFVDGLRERGWVESQNLAIDRRFPAEPSQPYSELVAALLRLPVDVLVTASSEAAWAAKKATSTTPIVVAVANLVGQGLAKSLQRPGGNLTGISNQLEVLQAKRYQLLRELARSWLERSSSIIPTIPRRWGWWTSRRDLRRPPALRRLRSACVVPPTSPRSSTQR